MNLHNLVKLLEIQLLAEMVYSNLFQAVNHNSTEKSGQRTAACVL